MDTAWYWVLMGSFFTVACILKFRQVAEDERKRTTWTVIAEGTFAEIRRDDFEENGTTYYGAHPSYWNGQFVREWVVLRDGRRFKIYDNYLDVIYMESEDRKKLSLQRGQRIRVLQNGCGRLRLVGE